jgi:uncharacterized protein involved in exopolysaccharide biosynthesis
MAFTATEASMASNPGPATMEYPYCAVVGYYRRAIVAPMERIEAKSASHVLTLPNAGTGVSTGLRRHYETIAVGELGAVWARRKLVVASILIALAIAETWLELTGLHYTGQAIIRPTFVREETAAAARTRPVAAAEAASLIESAAELIRSRSVASAVVTRLALDRDPGFTRPSFVVRKLSEFMHSSPVGRKLEQFVESVSSSLIARKLAELRAAVGLNSGPPDPDAAHDSAVTALMRDTKVSNDFRSYLITVSVTASDPAHAAMLANAIAAEYSREQAVQQLAESLAAAQQRLSDISVVYGPQHPSYLKARADVTSLESRLHTLRDPTAAFARPDLAGFDGGIAQSLMRAEKVMVPSGPNKKLVLAVAAVIGLGVGAALAMLFGRLRRRAV